MFENPLAEVLRGAFREWANSHPKYKPTYKKLNESGLRLVDIALGELDVFAPGPLWTWYTRHHMRFNKMRNEDFRLALELLQIFLADYAHGRLRKTTTTSSSYSTPSSEEEETIGSKAYRSERFDTTRRLPFVRGAKKPSD
jgi:hypothetical protein